MHDLPSKVLSITVQSSVGLDRWPFQMGPDDPYWMYGDHPIDYRWIIEGSITEQRHSSPRTRRPYFYDGMDVSVGDWISSIDGIPLKIVRILNKTTTHIKAIVEDVNRVNAMNDPSGSAMGMFAVPQSGLVFQTNQTGLPVLDPIPASGVAAGFYPNIMSRFLDMERWRNFIVHQPNHGFEVGDIVSLDGSRYVTSDTQGTIVGMVGVIYDYDHFGIDSKNKIIDDLDSLAGPIGSRLYMDSVDLGKMSVVPNKSAIMVVLRGQTPTYVRSTIPDAVTSPSTIVVNGYPVDFDGTQIDFVNNVNLSTPYHGIQASLQFPYNIVDTDPLLLDETVGEPAVYVSGQSPSLSINGVVVVINQTTYGLLKYNEAGWSVAQDIVDDINRAAIPNITASVIHNEVRLVNDVGGDIVLSNISQDALGRNLVGPNSAIGLKENNPAKTTLIVALEAPDSRAINLLTDGQAIQDFGLYSAENGTKAAGMYMSEGGTTTNPTVIVNTIADRNALTPSLGDQCYVRNTGEGSWGLYLWDGLYWNVISTQQSAATDALTLVADMDRSQTTVELGRITPSRSVTSIAVTVISPFDPQDKFIVGDDTSSDNLMRAEMIDLTTVGEYEVLPHVYYPSSVAIVANLTTQSVSGKLKVVLTYQ